MARFIADISGQAGETSRVGSPRSGIRGHVRGWHLGVRVSGSPLASNQDSDVFTIYATGGSNAHDHTYCLGSVRGENGRIFQLDDRISRALGLPDGTSVNLNDLT